MNKLEIKANNLKESLIRIHEYVNSHLDKKYKDDLSVRKDVFIDNYQKFLDVQEQVEAKDQTKKADRIAVETMFYDTMAMFKPLLEDSNAIVKSNANSSTSDFKPVKLPNVEIPIFTGVVEEWNSFLDLFTNLIDKNENLSDIQRLYYLRGFLKGEPLNLISNLRMISQNYPVALEALRKRFDSKYDIVEAHITDILNVPTITKGNAQSLRDFLTNVHQNIESLRALEMPVEQWDVILVCILTKKLDYQTQKAYELEKSINDFPTVPNFLEIVKRQCVALEKVSQINTHQSKSKHRTFAHVASNNFENKLCKFCSDKKHSIYQCFKFKECTVEQKCDFVNKNNLCYNCLKTGHRLNQCTSRGCKLCNKKHHTQLHKPISTNIQGDLNTNKVQQETDQADAASNATVLFNKSNSSTQILLATAQVNVVTAKGKLLPARALLDSGSQTSFITYNLFKQTKLRAYEENIQVLGLSSNSVQVTKMADIKMQACVTNYSVKLSCAILDNITAVLPHYAVNTDKFTIPSNFVLADPEYHTPTQIDLLIGADLFFEILLPESRSLGVDLPFLQRTKLGYVVSGKAPAHNSRNVTRALCSTTTRDVEEVISRFWRLEEVSKSNVTQFRSPQERLCEKSFVENTTLYNKQYTVRLPLIHETARSLLGGSFNIALRRFYSLERRLQKDKKFYSDYRNFINEYVSLGHAKYSNLDLSLLRNDNSDGYFLPHHAVIKESSSTTKLRVVFDASSKTTSGYSLNDILLTGPTVQPELVDILCKFRTYQYVLTADIEKMYRGVKVADEDTELQRILWRDHVNEPIKSLTLVTVTYGTSSAPYLATRCLVNLAQDYAADYPLAASALLSETYVDDILSGSNTISGLTELKSQLIDLLSLASFKLHKWMSNENSVISDTSLTSRINITDSDLVIKTLGLCWNPTTDTFQFSSPQNVSTVQCTKRNVLSFIGKMFDPLGLVAPVVVQGKLLLQQIWSRRLSWDDPLPSDLTKQWLNFENGIINMPKLLIPRWLQIDDCVESIELHSFSDASMKAYGTCIYLRVIYTSRSVSTRLICAKSRVAPLKTITLPRLELCGALVMARLTRRIIEVLNIKISEIYLWSDSSIVLHWLNSPPTRWNTFVANRVSEIQEITNGFHWLHVKTKDNPSDILSRGTDPVSLQTCEIWWNGPSWLNNYEMSFLKIQNVKPEFDIPDQRKVYVHAAVTTVLDFSRFSNLTRLNRVIVYCKRFIHNARRTSTRIEDPLTADEINRAHLAIIRVIQYQSFSKEIELLTTKADLGKSAIRTLNPFLDNGNFLRVSSRLANADLSYDQKFPLILPQNHHVTKLIIKFIHVNLLHAGSQQVLSHLRLRYWLANGKRQVKKVLNKCITCFRLKARTAEQLMGALPLERVKAARPFSRVGVDYGGPFFIRQSRLRKAKITKAYMALFVCMVTKAIHIELVSDLTTETFLLSLKRFISRRGKPSTIFSDNGLNFVGANNQLRELYTLLTNIDLISQVHDSMANQGITWKFIPPHSPHWGGIWESGIKSAKYHVKRVVGNLTLTYEELATVLNQIEAILNSRPLCPVSNGPNDLSFISPGHFLIHAPLTSYPEPDLTSTPISRLSFWQQCTQLQQQFWKRWRIEYLNQLQNRPKWFKNQPNISKNSLVLLKEDNVQPLQWPLARVIKVIPGRDGRTRLVQIKTKTGIFLRPITKLCVLPLE